jgi:hypothetical protein
MDCREMNRDPLWRRSAPQGLSQTKRHKFAPGRGADQPGPGR